MLILKFCFFFQITQIFLLISLFLSLPSKFVCVCKHVMSRRVYRENNTKQCKYLLASGKRITRNNILRPVFKSLKVKNYK